MIFVDSNVFVIALRYPRDRNARANATFLEHLRDRTDAVTSVVNLLEVCGILSFNLNERQLRGRPSFERSGMSRPHADSHPDDINRLSQRPIHAGWH
jgi:predicted nucleic acid-binding protein